MNVPRKSLEGIRQGFAEEYLNWALKARLDLNQQMRGSSSQAEERL